MRLWFVLFTGVTGLLAAAVFVWWQVDAERRRQKLVRNLASSVDPSMMIVQTRVLVSEKESAGGLAGLFRKAAPGARKGAKSGGAASGAGLYGKAKMALMTLGCAMAGFLAGGYLTHIIGPTGPVLAAIVAGALPRMYLNKNRNKRLLLLEQQFPEALDFLARSMRAGNAFSIGLELLGQEASEPLKSEIQKVTREMALGSGIEDALHNLVARVPLFEVRFFIAAVLLQRETGGNLSEVLARLAAAVRERMRLRGRIQAASGQGRLTARVLTCLPIATMLMLKLLSPAYMDAMTEDPLGRNLLAAAVVSQLLGHLVMQQIIKIEV